MTIPDFPSFTSKLVMLRPGYQQHRTIRFHVGKIFVLIVAALMSLSETGCSWLDKREGQSTDNCRVFIEKSFAAQQEGDFQSAQEYLNTAATLQPENAEAWWNLAELSIQRDQYEKAAEELEKYIHLRPTDPQGYLRLSQLYYLQNQYTQASEYVKQALQRVPDNIDALLLSARLARKQADHQQAIADYYYVLQVQPDHPDATLELAELLISRREPALAAPMLRALARKSITAPDKARSHLNLGIAYGQLDRWDDAVAQLETANKLAPNSTSRNQYRLAYAHWKAGESQQALKRLIEIADQGTWTSRAELLYSTITGTVPNYGLPDRLTAVSLETPSKVQQAASLLNESPGKTVMLDQLMSPPSTLTPPSITPPEWEQGETLPFP